MDVQDQVPSIHNRNAVKSPADPESALKRALHPFPWVGEKRDNYLFEYNSLFRTVHSSFKVQLSFILFHIVSFESFCVCACVCMCVKKTEYCSRFVRGAGLVHTSPKLWAFVWVTFSKMESEHGGLHSRSPVCSSSSIRFTSVFRFTCILEGFKMFSLWETSKAWSHCLVDFSLLSSFSPL